MCIRGGGRGEEGAFSDVNFGGVIGILRKWVKIKGRDFVLFCVVFFFIFVLYSSVIFFLFPAVFGNLCFLKLGWYVFCLFYFFCCVLWLATKGVLTFHMGVWRGKREMDLLDKVTDLFFSTHHPPD